MTTQITKKDLSSIEDKLDKRFDKLMETMSVFANDVADRFDQQNVRSNNHDSQFNRIETQHGTLSEQYNHLLNTIDGFIKRIDNYETEIAAKTDVTLQ